MPGADVVELRVHGVSGGQAEELLDVEPAVRVGGDRLAGFFRWRRKRDTEVVSDVPREIFAWGNLTSGRSSRALWLLLLPFTLVNVAYWMRPGSPGDRPSLVYRWADYSYGLSVRLLALSLTALLVTAGAGIGMDLVAWQCSGYGAHCAELRPWLGVLSAPGAALAEPGRALTLGALLPLAIVVGLWRLSRRTSSVYDVTMPADPAPETGAAPLTDPLFWRNSMTMGRLRSAHVAVAVSVVTTLLLVPALVHDLTVGSAASGSAVAVLVALTLAASTLSVLIPGTDPWWNRRADILCRVLRDTSILLLMVTVVHLLWPRPTWTAQGELPGYAVTLNTLLAVQCALTLLLALAAVVLYRTNRVHSDTAMRGMAGPVTAASGVLFGGVFSAAVVYQAAGWLGGCYYPGTEAAGCISLRPSSAYSWLQLGFTMEAAIALIVLAILTLVLWHRARALAHDVGAEYQRPPDTRRVREIARARAMARMTEAIPTCLAAFMVPVVALVLLALYATLTGRLTAAPLDGSQLAPAAVTADTTLWVQAAVNLMVMTGSWLGGLFLAALVWLGRSAYRDRPTRQALGVLWDVGTFWPRVAHPLAPPSYAERAVPQLTARIMGTTGRGTGIVLSGHSQGSVLAAATLWQLPGRCRSRVALLTHGSPLYRLYGRYFPAYFGPHALADLTRRSRGWRNLWRSTDAIGGPIHLERTDGRATVENAEPLPDPWRYSVQEGEALPPEILGHSYYTRDPAYAAAAEALVRDLGTSRGHRSGVLPGPVRTTSATDVPGGGPDVEEVDQGDDERDEGKEGHEPEGGAQGEERSHAQQTRP